MATTFYNSLQPAGYQIITATSATSAGLTIPSPSPGQTEANFALIVPETAAIRWRDDAVANGSVNGTSGTPLGLGQSLEYDGILRSVRIAAQTGTATVHVTYYRSD